MGNIRFFLMNFLRQTSIAMNQMRNNETIKPQHRKTIITLLFVWLLCTTILSQCFTSVLLKVYTIKKPSLTVQTLEEIINNPNLLVAGYIGLKQLEPYRPDIFHALEERVLNYHDRLNISLDNRMSLTNEGLVKDIIERKSVAIIHTFGTDLLKLFYPESNLMESEQKYTQLFRYSLVSKNFFKNKEIYDL